LLSAVVGCGHAPVVDTTEDISVAADTPAEAHVIGSGNIKLELVNATGKDIVKIQFKLPGEKKFSTDPELSGLSIATGEKFILAPQFPRNTYGLTADFYDLRLVCGDGTKLDIKDFKTSDVGEIRLGYEDKVGFLSYLDLSANKEISTKEKELKRKEKAEAAAEAERKRNAAVARSSQPRKSGSGGTSKSKDVCLSDPALELIGQ